MTRTPEADQHIDVLAIGPHPDDVELFCGGTVITLVDRGHTVAVVDLSRGERASRGTPAERALEAEAAAQVMGLTARENLGLPDTGLDLPIEAPSEGPRADATARLVEVIRRRTPELVLAPFWRARHPDHEAASALATRAIFYAGVRGYEIEAHWAPHRPRQVLYYEMRHQMRPDVVVDVSAAAERKMQAIRCHASQVGPAPEGGASTLVGSPLSLSTIEARDRANGALLGVTHGEPFATRAVVGLVDPLEHLRQNPFDAPFAFPAERS